MKQLLSIVFLLLTLSLQAQEPSDTVRVVEQPVLRFGFLSYDAALFSMPQYAEVQAQMASLKEAYDQEMKRVEDEFNQKYEAFLEGQREFPRTILLKRQNELQELLQRNVEFKEQARKELSKAEEDAMKPLRDRLNEVLAAVARQNGFALIINTDANACPFIDPALGVDVNEQVRQALQSNNKRK